MAKKKSPTGEVSVLGAVTTVAREVRKHKTVAESAPHGQGANIPPAPKRSPEELKRDIRAGRDERALVALDDADDDRVSAQAGRRDRVLRGGVLPGEGEGGLGRGAHEGRVDDPPHTGRRGGPRGGQGFHC